MGYLRPGGSDAELVGDQPWGSDAHFESDLLWFYYGALEANLGASETGLHSNGD